MRGFHARFSKEIAALTSASGSAVTTNVINPSQEDLAVWSGGAILASSSLFHKMTISRQDYLEFGETILRRKIF